MCGIAGIVTRHSGPDFLEPARQMTMALSHRGPDSAGVERIGPCALGNTRLAIIDLSEHGRQPMRNDQGNIWISYNGEIYNAAELRQSLQSDGYRFRSSSDTEVVLRLYEKFGESAVDHLRGMFAFAIWDDRAGKLVLGRDRLGIKPLYYTEANGCLIFASELKALLASGLVRRKLDPQAVSGFLQLGHIPPPLTAFENVRPLPPGHLGIWQQGKLEFRQYWSPVPGLYPKKALSEDNLAAQIGKVLLDCARRHLVSDVPVALFLSGGIDSACLAALVQNAGERDLTAVTLGFAEKQYDEAVLSQTTAKALGLAHRTLRLSAERMSEQLDHALWAMDQPTTDGINSYVISRAVAEAGFKVALTGQGADELFGGYESLDWFRRLTKLAELRSFLPVRPLAGPLRRSALPYRWRKLSYLLDTNDPFLAGQLAVKVVYPETDVALLLSPAVMNGKPPFTAKSYLAALIKGVEGEDFEEKVAYLDLVTHLQPRLLRDMDAMSMAHSLEVRPVYLDHTLVEFMLSVPTSMRLNKKRLLLAATKRFLPPVLHEDLLAREKRTFTFPFRDWMGGELRPIVEDAISEERLRRAGILNPVTVEKIWRRYRHDPDAIGWSRAWALFVLQRWCEINRAEI